MSHFQKGQHTSYILYYTPVSILPSQSKTFEKEIVNQLTIFIKYTLLVVVVVISILYSALYYLVLGRNIVVKEFFFEWLKISKCFLVKVKLYVWYSLIYLALLTAHLINCSLSKLPTYGCSPHPDVCNYIGSYYCNRKQHVKRVLHRQSCLI